MDVGAGAAGGVLEHAASKIERSVIAAKNFIRSLEVVFSIARVDSFTSLSCKRVSKASISGAMDPCNEISSESSSIQCMA